MIRVYLRGGLTAECPAAVKAQQLPEGHQSNLIQYHTLSCTNTAGDEVASFQFTEVIGWVVVPPTRTGRAAR